MAEAEVKEAPSQKPKKVTLRLTGAGSCNYDGIVLKKGETVELSSSQADQFMTSGLFERL